MKMKGTYMKPRISPVTLQQPLLETISGSDQGSGGGPGRPKSLRNAIDLEIDEYNFEDYEY